jgi:predicted ATPase
MVSHLLGTEDIDSDLEELILEKTEGVPFFIEEFIRSLKDLNIIEREDNKYRLAKDVQEVTIPSTIHDVIMARVDSLTESAKELLQIGSVIEREFSYELIKQVTGLQETELLSHLSILKDSELLYERGIYPESTYIFKHALTREVAYDSILTHRKKRLHEEIGDAIEELCRENIDDHYEALAHHYSNTTHLEKAIHYLELAGDKATKYFSLGEARKLYRAAIDLLDSLKKSPDTKDSYIALSLKWAEVSHYVASEEHLKILETSLKFAQDLKDETRLAKTTYWMGRMYYSLGKIAQALSFYEQCIEMAGELRDEEMLALPYNVIGRTCLFTSEWAKGIDYLEKGILMLEGVGNLEEVAYSKGILGLIHGFTGDFEKAVTTANRGLEISIDLGNKTREAMAYIYLECLNILRGSWNQALKHGARAVEISKQIENPVIEGMGCWLMGCATFYEGDQQKGIDMIRAGIEKIEATASSFTFGLAFGWLAEANALKGRKEMAELCARKSIDLAKIGERWGEVRAYSALAIAAAKEEQADWNTVDANMRESIRLAEERGSRPDQAISCFRYAELLRDKGDLEQARDFLTQAIDLFTEMNMTWWLEQAKKL